MTNELKITHYFDQPVETLFPYFVEAKKIEQWCNPDGMTLKIPKFEAKNGGDYRYEHTSKEGTYVCTGHVREIVPNERLRMMDEKVTGPKGEVIMQNSPCETYFHKKGNGTEVEIVQSNFPSEEFKKECETSWNQCFRNLENVFKDAKGAAA